MGDADEFQSTLPVRGATGSGADQVWDLYGISIHAPREGSDFSVLFLSGLYYISIHAPREGSDLSQFDQIHHLQDISIHAPREGSDLFAVGGLCQKDSKFQSTLPVRGATLDLQRAQDHRSCYFNPRSP